jgi:hypothetical protein
VVNIPGLPGGDKTVNQTGITAPNLEAAIAQAKASIVIEAVQVVRTFP